MRIQLRDGPRDGESVDVDEVIIDDVINVEAGEATAVYQVRRQCPVALDFIAIYVASVPPD